MREAALSFVKLCFHLLSEIQELSVTLLLPVELFHFDVPLSEPSLLDIVLVFRFGVSFQHLLIPNGKLFVYF